ncbi:hypothetical protein FZEAL_10869, partial [Fusarium zealandicum]
AGSNWTASATTQSTTLNRPRPAPRPTGEDAFPALPAAPKPTTTIFGYGNGRAVRRDYGNRETGFQWGTGSGPSTPSGEDPGADGDETAGKGKKGGKKGKGKVLVQWG